MSAPPWTSRFFYQNKEQQRQVDRLARVAKETTNAVVITDVHGRVEWVNDSFTRITEYTLDEMMGRKPGQVLQGPETDAEVVAQMRRAIKAHQPFDTDLVNYTKSGRRFLMHVSCTTLHDPSGHVDGFLAIETDITPQKEDEARTRDSLAQLKKLTANVPGIIYQYQLLPDGRSCMPYVSEGLASFYGIYAQRVEHDASQLINLIHPEDKADLLESVLVSAEQLSVWEERFRIVHPSGRTIWVEGRATPERLTDGSTLWHGFMTDVTKQKRLEQAQQDQAMHTQAVLDNVLDGIITIDPSGVICSLNHAAEKTFGYRSNDALGKNIAMLLPGVQQGTAEKPLWDRSITDVKKGGRGVHELQAVHKHGQKFPVDIAFSKIQWEGKPIYISVMHDISERKNAEEKISSLAFYDSLTKIPNRRLFYDRLEHARSSSKRLNTYGALLFIDMDKFKQLNDTAGHDMGDRLLEAVAKRLMKCIRENDTVARLGGDEFMVLLEDLGKDVAPAVAHAEYVGEKIRQSLAQPYPEVSFKYNGSSSVGITLFCDNEEPIDEVLKQVDMAMYQAKAEGRNKVAFFDPDMQNAAVAYATMERDLSQALHDEQFELFYQIQVNVDGKPTGAEALLRWYHPDKGWVSPGDFMPVAEETRLILPIGRWVLEAACQQAATWASKPATQHLTLAVNVSAVQVNEPDFVDQVLTVLRESNVDPGRIKLELTETSLASDIENAIAKMTALRQKGVHFALDDFGTGYSSLAYLKRMPIEQLKIDRSFVCDILRDRNDKLIAKSIIALADSMELAVIAEGVETEEHRNAC